MSVFTNPASASAEHAAAYTAAVLGLVADEDPQTVLAATPGTLRQLIEGLSGDELSMPESAGKWSIRHVLRHLADSELVWGWRLRMVLAHDRPALTGYDQDLWSERLHYGDSDEGESLEVFTVLRRAHLRLLEGLTSRDLQRVGVHTERGDESVAHMLRLYAGHDLLHLRQIERIRGVVTRTA